MELAEIFNMLANGIDPSTGEVFDISLLGRDEAYSAFKQLKTVVSEEHKKASKKGRYRRLCDEYPDYIVLVKMGVFYTAYGEAAEILGQILGYKVAYMSGYTPTTGGPDLNAIVAGLQAAKLSYIVFNGSVIEDKFDGNNPFI